MASGTVVVATGINTEVDDVFERVTVVVVMAEIHLLLKDPVPDPIVPANIEQSA